MAANLELTAREDISEKLFKLEQQNQRLIEQNKQLAKVTKQGHDDVSASIENGIGKIKSMGMEFFGVSGAIATIKSETDDWINHLKEVADVQERIRDSLSDLYGTTKLLAVAPQVESFLANVPGLNREQATRLFSGVAKADPQAGLNKLKAITTAAAPVVSPL